MGGGKGGSSNQQLESAQSGLASQLTSLLSQQQSESGQLFNLAFPGMTQATDFYQTLASGSPDAIARVIAPAAQQIQTATAGAKQNILTTAPAGGEKNLAIEQADVAQDAQVGSLASQGYTSAFPALAQLGGQGVGLGQGAASTAISAGSAANSIDSSVIQEHIQQKGASLGAFGALGQSVAGGIGGGLGAADGGASTKGAIAAGLGAF